MRQPWLIIKKSLFAQGEHIFGVGDYIFNVGEYIISVGEQSKIHLFFHKTMLLSKVLLDG